MDASLTTDRAIRLALYEEPLQMLNAHIAETPATPDNRYSSGIAYRATCCPSIHRPPRRTPAVAQHDLDDHLFTHHNICQPTLCNAYQRHGVDAHGHPKPCPTVI